jgi:GNAT superfamily N-acetyltransferase
MTETGPLRIETYTGERLRPLLGDLARLRTVVFRDWPYLYDGDPRNEERHLATYMTTPLAGVPLAAEPEPVRVPFLARGWDPARFFYFGESVLLPEWRGRGVGVEFFRQREAHARAVSDADFSCFCAVQRPADHPARPADYVPLDGFWARRGYRFYHDLCCRMSWKEVGQAGPGEHTLCFWMKALRGAALP